MAVDLTIILEDRPGTLADLGETLGKAGINIEGGCGVPYGGIGEVHILVEDASAAKGALQGAGIEVKGERDVITLSVEDHPGEFGGIARNLANAGVNINLFYLTADKKLVLGVDDMEKAKAAL